MNIAQKIDTVNALSKERWQVYRYYRAWLLGIITERKKAWRQGLDGFPHQARLGLVELRKLRPYC